MTDLTETIHELLDALLLDQITRHIPDDPRIGIPTSAYWISYIPSGETYVGVDHELPVFNRSLGGAGGQQIMFGLNGGVLVTTTLDGITSAGTWTDGVFEEQASI